MPLHSQSSLLSTVLVVSALVGCNARVGDPPGIARDGDVFYLNTFPRIPYVGSHRCAACHEDIHRSYTESEMGRSLSLADPVALANEIERSHSVQDPSTNFVYEVVVRDGRLYQREFRKGSSGELLHERFVEARYVVGSGNNLKMFFSEENGMLYELPLTWYVHRKEWDLSPGYRDFANLRFSRYATPKCLSCHDSFPDPSPVASDRYVQPVPLGIGCERCHGPGALHIAQQFGDTLTDIDPQYRTIVNPRLLTPQRQLDVCQQCHLQGKAWALQKGKDWFDFRPGQLLASHRSVFFEAHTSTDVFEVADSPQRLAQSRCFKESGGTLTCITCHDPHRSIKSFTPTHYNNACLGCHTEASLDEISTPHSSAGDCISCHMKKTGTDNTLHGVSNTDHWIRIGADTTKINWSTLRGSGKLPVSLRPFLGHNDAGSYNRRGIAYFTYYREEDQRSEYLDSAIAYLRIGTTLDPDDKRGWLTLGEAELEQGISVGAIGYFDKAISLDPNDPWARFHLASAYRSNGKLHDAIVQLRTALSMQPGEPRFMEQLGGLLHEMNEIHEAESLYIRALRVDRQNPYSFSSLAMINVHNGKLDQALEHFQYAIMIDPDVPELLLNLGNVYAMLGRYQEALRAYQRELKRDPQSVAAHANTTRVYQLMGDRKNVHK